MSKQSDARAAQGYAAKAVPATCQNCMSFCFDRVQTQRPTTFNPQGWWEDKNQRCGIGGFAVKKMGTCSVFERKTEETSK